MTLEELKALYKEKGATEKRYIDTEQGRTEEDVGIDYGDGWTAFENDNRKIIDYIGQGMDATPVYDNAPKTLGGFSKQEGDYITDYDLTGKPIAKRKWNESDWVTMRNDLGPIAMAALSGYLGGIPLGETGLTAGNALSAARAIENKDVLGLLSSGSGAFDTAGVDFGGMSAKDVAKYASLAKGLTSGGAGTISALASLTKDANFNNLMSSLGGFDVNPKDFTEGYFLPGGEGWIDPNSKTEGVTGPGYYDEITGAFIKDSLGTLQNPLASTVGNLDPNQKWEYNLTRPGVWTNDKGEEIDLSYLPNTEKTMTGAEIMAKAGALPKVSSGGSTTQKGSNVATPATSSVDLASLLSLLGQGTPQTSVITSQDPYAHIKLMEELFGPEIDLTPAGDNTEKRK